jgi:peptide/nickel transport system substrate-binding protein
MALGGTANAQLAAVQSGRADFMSHPPPTRLQELRTQYSGQLHVTPAAQTYYLVLNTRRPPFGDVRARRAVAFAFDRGSRLLDGFGAGRTATPTCQLLPPNFPAYRPYCPYTAHPTKRGPWTAPDLARALTLVAASGTKGMRIDVLGYGEKDHALTAMTTVLDETLRRLGYRTSVTRITGVKEYFAALWKSAPQIEAAIAGWGADISTPAAFITSLLTCRISPSSPYSCGPAIDRKLRETLDLQIRNPQEASEAWARLERELVDQAIVVPVITGIEIEFVSKRLGNYQRHPYFGMLISQVWVR